MAEPKLVAEMVKVINDRLAAMSASIPVTVKTRIGIDNQDSDAFLDDFVGTVSQSGCDTFIIHARKAWLSGLSPKENREIPPLVYDRAYKLKRDFPQFTVAINGGVKDLTQTLEHLKHVDGVMIGRAAYDAPYALLAQADALVYGDPHEVRSETDIARAYLDYAAREVERGTKLHAVTRHAAGLFTGKARRPHLAPRLVEREQHQRPERSVGAGFMLCSMLFRLSWRLRVLSDGFFVFYIIFRSVKQGIQCGRLHGADKSQDSVLAQGTVAFHL